MKESEVVTFTILFHMSAFRTLKDFYICFVKGDLKAEFPNNVSYNRIKEWMLNTSTIKVHK